ncbi:PD-(D/E)XK motif protein [Nocardioides dubius]|uniref:PD-(D/E)XK motif protein n=1 Tax=Nocardioides dubius TaxID=317019 RepID=A0ABN1U554_9ACTN
MPSQDLEGVWTVLATTPPASGIEVAPTGNAVAAGEVLVGVDHLSRRHLLIPLLPGEAARTDTKGRGVHLARLSHGSTAYLTVLCLLPELHHVFTQFCRELIDTVAGASSPAREAAVALDRWRALFSDADRRGLVSDEVLTGLLGELLIVERLLRLGAPGDLRFWCGPFHELHDIRSASHAIEVKATLVREGRIVSISSVDQLQEPAGSDLLLVHTRLDTDPAGFNLSDLVHRNLEAGAHRREIDRRLHELGIAAGDLTPYAARRFSVPEVRFYDVVGFAFPRLLRSSFAEGDVPPGTLRIGYAIDLTNEPPQPLDQAEIDLALTALATEAASEVDP